MPSNARVMIVAATAAYQTEELARAAERLGVEVALGTDRCHVLAEEWWAEGALALDFRDPGRASEQIAEHAGRRPLHGLIATDERTAYIAALAARELGLPGNPPAAVREAWSKRELRDRLAAAGHRQPAYRLCAPGDDPVGVAAELGYPVVIKPLHLSASRGVMRADDPAELAARVSRLRALLADPEVRVSDPSSADCFLMESFVPGPELALEGLLVGGELQTLAVFDKPDPLEGPFFPETIYVTPSAIDSRLQHAIAAEVAAVAATLGLTEGPIHAEVRIAEGQPITLELAARSIGGLCARSLRFGAGISLEELVIAHAIGRPLVPPPREHLASGVMMLPVPEPGVLRSISGLAEARAVPTVRDVVITAREGDTLVPLPEGHTYLGFIFAAAPDRDQVIAALRTAAGALTFRTAPRL